ncbi:MAG TPA: hypothetical protein EYP98_12750 [Planctomycetes bacterium]|nr:hypothetical protein [Planctomycetota bacterium]
MLPQRPQGGPEPLRIYLVGAHATGKTTLARWIRDRYHIPMIAEVARGVLAEMEEQLQTLRTDIDLVDRYQAAVFTRQIDAENAVDGSFVSDRLRRPPLKHTRPHLSRPTPRAIHALGQEGHRVLPTPAS